MLTLPSYELRSGQFEENLKLKIKEMRENLSAYRCTFYLPADTGQRTYLAKFILPVRPEAEQESVRRRIQRAPGKSPSRRRQLCAGR
jgi:hypothetical protein